MIMEQFVSRLEIGTAERLNWHHFDRPMIYLSGVIMGGATISSCKYIIVYFIFNVSYHLIINLLVSSNLKDFTRIQTQISSKVDVFT